MANLLERLKKELESGLPFMEGREIHSAAAVAVFLRQVRAWKICTDELHISSLQFVVFFVQGN